MIDQADKLREMALNVKKEIENEMTGNFQKTRVVVVSSGKGGVGKSTIALNISLTLCSIGKKVVLMDADMGMANIDIMLGIVPEYNIYHIIQGKKTIKDIIIQGPGGLELIPGGSGIYELANLSQTMLQRLLVELGRLDGEYDYMVIDTGAGISQHVISFLLAADDVIIITTPEPTSLTDAYGIVKTVSKKEPFQGKLYLIVNRVKNDAEGKLVAEKFKLVCDKFLSCDIRILGNVVNEPLIAEGIRRQQVFIQNYPQSVATKDFYHIVDMLLEGNSEIDADIPKPVDGIKKFFKKVTSYIR